MLKFKELINRLRHNRGFGVQSPSAFYFVTQVLKEKLPYYAYDSIDKISQISDTHSRKYCRRLFRVVNFLHPKSIIVIGSARGAALCSLAAACPSASLHTIDKETKLAREAKETLQHTGCIVHTGDEAKLAKELLLKSGDNKLIYIGDSEQYAQIAQVAIAHATRNTIIIVEQPHKEREKEAWWEQAVLNRATRVTYDLYSAGILFFDDEKQKQHYTLLM